MAAWAYECQSAAEADERWLVACLAVDSMPGMPAIVRVRIGNDWRCARVDRTRRLEVQATLLRDVIASDLEDCPECAEPPRMQAADGTVDAPDAQGSAERGKGVAADGPRGPETARASAPARSGRQVQAAAISMHERQFVIVLVNLDLVRSTGEADMAIADLRPRFGDVDLVLMAQDDDGTPHYHGDAALLQMLSQVPVDRMPWKSYPI